MVRSNTFQGQIQDLEQDKEDLNQVANHKAQQVRQLEYDIKDLDKVMKESQVGFDRQVQSQATKIGDLEDLLQNQRTVTQEEVVAGNSLKRQMKELATTKG